MKSIIHLVLETPGANAHQILFDATQEDEILPIFLFPENYSDHQSSWNFSTDKKSIEFSPDRKELSDEVFIFLSHQISLADQIESTLHTFQNSNQFIMGRFFLFIYSPILLKPPSEFLDWLDGAIHFTDIMLFTDRSNETGSRIKEIKDRYDALCYPLENFILSKKNNPWSRILDPSPRRISHVFDDPQLLDPEDLPENDRYLEKFATGERKRAIPLIFASPTPVG